MSEEVNIDDILVLLRNNDYGPEALKALIDAIEAKLDEPDNFKADVSALATVAALVAHNTEVKAEINANETKIDALPGDADIGDFPWDELQAAHVAAGSFGKQIKNVLSLLESIYPQLTVAGFQASPVTGTAAGCHNINDGLVFTTTTFAVVGMYCEIHLGCCCLIKQFKHYGYSDNNEDGFFKLQYYECCSSTWKDWKTGISTRLDSWSDWEEVYAVMTNKIRIVLTTTDTSVSAAKAGEFEIKY